MVGVTQAGARRAEAHRSAHLQIEQHAVPCSNMRKALTITLTLTAALALGGCSSDPLQCPRSSRASVVLVSPKATTCPPADAPATTASGAERPA